MDQEQDNTTAERGGARMPVRRWEVILLAAIMIVGVGLRFGYWSEHRGDPDVISPGLDAGFHDYWATGLATGEWAPSPGHDDPRVQATPFFRPPGYPYFLSVIYRIAGPSIPAATLVQTLLGMIAVVLALLLVRPLLGRAVGLTVAAGMSWYWALIYFEQELLDSTLLVVLGLLLLLSLRGWIGRVTWRRAIVSGIVLGCFALTRPNVLLVGPAIVGWAWWLCRRRGAEGTLAAALIGFPLAVAMTVAPATIRNYVVAGEFVLISSNGGVNLHIGNNEETDCVWPAIPELQEITGQTGWTCFDQPKIVRGVSRLVGRPMSHSEVSGYFAAKAMRFIVQNPLRVLALTGKKALLFWGPAEISNNKEIAIQRADSVVLSASVPFAAVLALAITGVAIGVLSPRRPGDSTSEVAARRRGEMGAILVLFVVVYFASFLPFFAAARYRAPLLPYLFMPAAYALCRIGAWAWVGQWRFVGAGLAGAAAILFVASINIFGYEPNESSHHQARGAAYSRLREWDRASAEYRLAIEVMPGRRDSKRSLANTLFRGGHLAEAARELEWLLVAEPDEPEVHNLFAAVLADQNRPEQAIAHYVEALRLSPDYFEARYDFALYLMRLGRIDGALAHYDLLATLAPDDSRVWFQYGMALRRADRVEESDWRLARAVTLDPGLAEQFQRAGIRLTAGPAQADPSEAAAGTTDVKALRARADKAADVGRLDAAIDLCRRALAISPDDPAIHFQLAGMLVEAHRPGEAIGHYRRVLSAQPEIARFHFDIGVAFAATEDIESCIKHFREALRIEPDFLDARYSLAQKLVAAKRFDEALEAMDGLESQPRIALLHFDIGVAFGASGEGESAIKHYSETLRIEPDWLEARYNLAQELVVMERFDEALAAMKRALKLVNRSSRADLTARIQDRIAQLEAAVESARAAPE